MRKTVHPKLESGRIDEGHWASTSSDGLMGAFLIDGRKGGLLRIISSGPHGLHGWEHVSVSLVDRCPTWDEMCAVKALFWAEHECVVQYHPPEKDYVDNHPYTLHLWRPFSGLFPMPPKDLIA